MWLLFSDSVTSNSYVTPWTVDHQATLSVRFSRPEYWSGLPFPLLGIFLTQGSNLHLLYWQAKSLSLSHLGSHGLYLNAHTHMHTGTYTHTHAHTRTSFAFQRHPPDSTMSPAVSILNFVSLKPNWPKKLLTIHLILFILFLFLPMTMYCKN